MNYTLFGKYNVILNECAGSEKICYIIVPEGLEDSIADWIRSERNNFDVTFVTISGLDWNNDLTPWPAEGVFKKAKPFGGKCDSFMMELSDEIIPEIETNLSGTVENRTLVGISLSGLYAVWSIFNCEKFNNVISISGSLWYDGFMEWTLANTPLPNYKKVYLTLGNREKCSKNTRIATVQDRTEAIYEHIGSRIEDTKFELFEGTHFSPITENLENGLKYIYRKL